jgi:hypothetical protein
MSALPRKQICAVQGEMSALCQKRTLRHSFDHLVGALLQKQWHVQPKRLGGLEVDDQFELGRDLDWKVGRLLALEDAIDIGRQARDEVSQHEKIVSMDRENAVLSGCCQTKIGSGAVDLSH